MPRPENPIDPNAPAPVREIATALREARAQAGNPDYRSMGKRVNYSSTALSQAASGKRFPSLPLTRAYLESLQAGPEVLEEWERRWTQAKQDLAAIPTPAPAETITTASTDAVRLRDSAELVRFSTSSAPHVKRFHLPGFGIISTRSDWSRAMYWLRHRSLADGGKRPSINSIAASARMPAELIRPILAGERIPGPLILDEVLRVLGATRAECRLLLVAADHLRTVPPGPDYTSGPVSTDSDVGRETLRRTSLEERLQQIVKQNQQAKPQEQSVVEVEPEGNQLYPLLHRLIRTPAFWAWAQRVTMALLGLIALLIWLLAK